MKSLLIAAGVAVVFLCFGVSHAALLGLEEAVNIRDGSGYLNVGDRSATLVIDWNNDGKKDLVVGDGYGYVWLYLNQGTNIDPVFNGGVKIESSGTAIRVGIASGG